MSESQAKIRPPESGGVQRGYLGQGAAFLEQPGMLHRPVEVTITESQRCVCQSNSRMPSFFGARDRRATSGAKPGQATYLSTADRSLGRTEVLICGIHLPGYQVWSGPFQRTFCRRVASLSELWSPSGPGPVSTRNATRVGVVGYMVVLLFSTLGLASYFCLVAGSHQVIDGSLDWT